MKIRNLRISSDLNTIFGSIEHLHFSIHTTICEKQSPEDYLLCEMEEVAIEQITYKSAMEWQSRLLCILFDYSSRQSVVTFI